MKRKSLKVAAFLGAMVLILGLGAFANALVGNPVSKGLASRTAKKYLKETYSDTDFYVESVDYSFKEAGYYAHIRSESSMDSHFSFRLDMLGKLKYDSYEHDVLSGWNTWRRLDNEYRELADSVFESPAFPYGNDIGYGTLELLFTDREVDAPASEPVVPQEPLVLDKLYDIQKLGKQYGRLCVHVQEEEVNTERAAEILLGVKNVMDEGGVPFCVIDFTLRYPRPEEGEPWRDGQISILNFRYEDIYEEGMTERVQTAYEDTTAYYAEMDAKK